MKIEMTLGVLLLLCGTAGAGMTCTVADQRDEALDTAREAQKVARRAIIAHDEAANTVRAYRDTLTQLRYQLKNRETADDWSTFIEALIFVESSGRPDAVGDDSLAVGVLQIQPCVVDDLFIAGHDYTLNDRYDRQKSIEMFNAYQRIYNPERNIERAIHLHNPRAGVKYRDRIIEKMNELKP